MTTTTISQTLQKSTWKKPALMMAVISVAVLAGCSSKPAYNSATGKGGKNTTTQVITNANGVPNRYQVKQGDTVSRIAQRYGLDWREIGRMNNLNSSYTIFTGQWLTLWTGKASTARQSAQSQQPARQTSVPVVATQAPRQQAPASSTPPVNAAPSAASAPFAGGSSGVMQFRYPVGNSNPVVRRFGTATVAGSTVTSNGMWFSGRDGDPIQASRAGTVIHADGNRDSATIVIQHTDGFTSSYIHIKDATVRSGDSVQVGQRIASMKNQAGGAALFEFRIARNNVYVDPLTVLK